MEALLIVSFRMFFIDLIDLTDLTEIHSTLRFNDIILVGHYIAYCVNQVDGIWYEFDDSFVKAVSEEEVAGVEAYVLFYQKRSDFALDEIDDF